MTATPPTADDGPSSPNQYQLHNNTMHISYFPDGSGSASADDPVVLTYEDPDRSLTFHRTQVSVTEVAGFGSCVTVTLASTPDVATTTATLVVPTVVLRGQHTAGIGAPWITTSHPAASTGPPETPLRDEYTVNTLVGDALFGVIPG